MTTLRDKQSAFVMLIAGLIFKAWNDGYQLTFGEAYRSPEEAARLAAAGIGIVGSLHCHRLAIDLNLFKDGVYLSSTEDWRPLGEWWESCSTADITCCWGGRFEDGNHFSIAHEGKK